MKSKNTTTIILLCGALTAIAPFSIDMYLPGFPFIAGDLNTDISRVGLSLSSFLGGISFGQLIYGPALDRYGRKRPLLFGLCIYVLGSLGCALSTSVEALIGMRLLQALGGCAGMVASRAIIRDVFAVGEIARVLSILMLIMGIAPIIAPTAGGLLVSVIGWRSIFLVLAAFGCALIFSSCALLPKGGITDTTVSIKLLPVLRSYGRVVGDLRFLPWALAGGLGSAGMFAYISGSPFVFMELLGFGANEYGWLFGMNAFGLIAASQLNRLLLPRLSSQQIVRFAVALQCLTGALMLAGVLSGRMPRMGVPALVFLYLFWQGFLVPNAMALAMAPFSHNAGAASAMIGFMGMVAGAGASVLVSRFHNGTALPMTAVMALCTGVSLLSLLILRPAASRSLL